MFQPYKGSYYQTPGYETKVNTPKKSTLETLKNKYGKVVLPSEFVTPVSMNIINPRYTAKPPRIPMTRKLHYPGENLTNYEKEQFDKKIAAKLENNNTWNNDILSMSQEELNSLERARKRTSSDPKSITSRSSTPFKGGKRKARHFLPKTKNAVGKKTRSFLSRRFTKRRAKRSTRKH